MRPVWHGTRVCGPCVVSLDGRQIAVAAIYGRGRDGDMLEYCVRPIMADSFDFTGPASMVADMQEGIPTLTETSLGRIEIRPLAPSDGEWIPVIPGINHTPEMLAMVIQHIDLIESSDDEGFFEPEESDPIEKIELLVSSTTNRAFGACWMIDDPDFDLEDARFRSSNTWSQHPPTAHAPWVRDGGPTTFDWASREDDFELWNVHASAATVVLKRLDQGLPIGRLSTLLASYDQNEDHILGGDLPQGQAKALADEWLASGGDPEDILVRFGEGRAELPVDLILQASLDRDQRVSAQASESARDVDGSAWLEMADLAIAATDRHLWHEEPCDDIHCKRMNVAIGLMTAVDGPLDPFGDRKDVVNGMRYVIDDLVRCAPAPRPFTGVLEAPFVYVRFAQDWRERLSAAADTFDEVHRRAIAEAYASLFPSCGSMRVEAELERAGLSVPEPEFDELWG